MLLTAVPIADHAAALSVVGAAGAVCAFGGVACLRGWIPRGRSWAAMLLSAVGVIVVADLVTGDATATGLVFFLVPPLVAAAQLPSRAAWFTAGVSLVGLAVVVTMLLPLDRALVDGVNVAAFVVLVTWLVSRGQDRTDSLVAELQRQAAIDPLTGLVTRRVLDEALRSALEGTAAACGNALVIVDIDKFKSVNDTWGHPVGDAAITHVGRVLARACGPDAVVSRLGGDELAALLPGRSPAEAAAVAEHVVVDVRAAPLVLGDGREVPLTVSVGAAHSPVNAADLEGLYRAADEALYRAKRAGRDRAVLNDGDNSDDDGSADDGPVAPAAALPAQRAFRDAGSSLTGRRNR
ncbi:diguanylate cyclase (GGDEF) domain-containing protein [Quadrisphaera granulorum]|uniref:Diguanylate cyclase (GGDEF)-like protein n=1 Tax=Quadrisphaera granulorum TaxID=317664 RepID=A0A315ZNI3_9ACTN|nr:GGDEF domain-containing protein [Quadrisphaera granulorum]PWJ47056.1 diguanylate cyclase (GGDEF)-like protein [Quadrisphaera granulorum]SZE98957.1 diguanylate cyclase (GGDEF) domain-containing protein [Quadrisphaera granulorum]